jgi:hypothetical protein
LTLITLLATAAVIHTLHIGGTLKALLPFAVLLWASCTVPMQESYQLSVEKRMQAS